MDVNRRDVIGAAAASGAVATLGPLSAARAAPAADAFGPPPAWYDREALRISWNILRDVDGGRNGAELVEQAVAAGVNAICITVGGSFAFYPTKVPFHQRSNALPPGRDLVGEVAAAARRHGVRMIARFDFSKQSPETQKAHPEWFYIRPDGSYSSSQGRYRPCLNAGFYREVAPAIVAEVVERYRPAMLFFNNFSNTSNSRETVSCQCPSCTAAWARRHPGQPLPKTFTPEYLDFMREEAELSAAAIEMPIRRKYPDILLLNANVDPTDGLHTESRMIFPSVSQPWVYETSEATDRQLNSKPGKISFNLCVSYSSNFSRLVVMPPAETRVHMYQAIASGSHPGYAMTGTLDQPDREALGAAKQVFAWHKRNADLYVGQRNAARVLLLCRPSIRARTREAKAEASEHGLYQILAENHVPIASAETNAAMLRNPGRYDLVIVSRGAPLDGVEPFVRAGGKAIFVDQHPGFAIPAPVGTLTPDGMSYWRIRNRNRLPGFPAVDFIEAGGGIPDPSRPTLQLYPPEPDGAITLVPPMFEEPAEQAASNMRDTDTPGILWRSVGNGQIAFLPWDLGVLYNQSHLSAHAQLLMAVMRGMVPWGGEIETDAAPAVQMVLMEQTRERRKLLHLINLSGQTGKGFNDPVRTGPIRIALRGTYRGAESRALGQALGTSQANGRTIVTLPSLQDFDSLVFS
jgi:hypothetical protein